MIDTAIRVCKENPDIKKYFKGMKIDYERIVDEDMKKSAIVIAAAVYHVAMRDEMLPRFSKDKMPAPPKGQ
jgi:hypothetical protein